MVYVMITYTRILCSNAVSLPYFFRDDFVLKNLLQNIHLIFDKVQDECLLLDKYGRLQSIRVLSSVYLKIPN